MNIISAVYNLLWGDLITIPLPGGGSAGLSLLVLILIPAFTLPYAAVFFLSACFLIC